MSITEEKLDISTKLGHTIAGKLLKSDGNNNLYGTVIIAPAMGVRNTFYNDFGNYLAEHGFVVILFDYYGIGDSLSGSIKKISIFAHEWGTNDIQAVVDWVKANCPTNIPIFYVGHSIGGQLIGLLTNPNEITQYLLITSQNGYWKLYKARKYRFMLFYYFIWPPLTKLFGYFPFKLFRQGENVPKNVALQWNKWLKSKNYLFDDLRLNTKNYNKLTGKILSISFSDDNYAPLNAVNELLKHFPEAEIKTLHFSPEEFNMKRIGHFGFFKKKSKDLLWPYALEYFSEKNFPVKAKMSTVNTKGAV